MTRKLTICAAVLAAAALPAAAQADGPPPVPGGTHCTMEAKRTYRHAAVLKRGLPVKVTCDGPATVFVGLEFDHKSRADKWVFEHLYTDSSPGAEAFTKEPVRFESAATRTLRLGFWPWAQRVAARFPRTRVHVMLAVEREDGELWSVVGPGQRAKSTLVR